MNVGYLGLTYIAAGLGAGLIVIGAAIGIALLSRSALDGMARQPENSGNIRTTMIIAAALIEGFTFFALIVTLMLAIKEPKNVEKKITKPPASFEKKM